MNNSDWNDMASLCEEGFKYCSFKEELIELCGNDLKIAWVVYHHNNEASLKWMRSKVPVLKGKSPLSCIPSNLELLKKTLLSFPC